MNILLLEDEQPAAERIQRMLAELRPDATILAVIDSVEGALAWLSEHPAPDLALFDIHLADGLSLEVLEQSERAFPVIFTTAYDEYALQAFGAYSIDYLLKPVRQEELKQALDKFERFKDLLSPAAADVQGLARSIRQARPVWQQRFLLRLPEQIKAIDIQEIAYFYIESRLTFMQLKDGKCYPSDFNLEQLEERVDPARFFRVNRQFLVSFEAIDKMYTHTKSRVQLQLKPAAHLEATVPSERSAEFKRWLQGG